ncbi:trimethylamine methyltransferase [Prosthecomicrobium hirschii]|uniref:trimethylamine methyltransferase family protein n=1 Tax=Prosthecodimorpha hirschii TaxID=665126 RepID=UPI00112877CB|nr:trimethylamine methyltransferase family protein [Prosthecomicrobium hirschii]TPQ50295.1 trimethylamine methyltransferase [Prosthecomicrobium hirschii]
MSDGARMRSGGRAARQRVRQAGSPPRPAFLTRTIPPYAFLSEEGLVRIEQAADRLLAEVGFEIRGDEEANRLFVAAGATLTDGRLRFPAGLLRSIIQAFAPATFVQHARNPARNVVIGGDAVVFAPAYGSPFVTDLESGRRYGTIADFENFVKLAYASPYLHHSGGTVCEPVDLPVNKRHLDMVAAHIRFSDKPFMGSVTTAARAADSIDMARLVFGEAFVDRHCVILGNVNVNSPLLLDGEAARVIRTYAAANQAAVCVPFILGGAMGPVTTAGALAQCFAEAMVCVALTQLVRPGAPAILGNFLSSMSLKSGAPTFGTPEPALAYFAIGQLARRLGVPLRCGGNLCASKLPDAQAASESANSLWPALLAGAHFVLHAAGWLEGGLSMSYEKFMIDAEQLGAFHVLAGGLALDEDSFALDAFRSVPPGGHFLGSPHTLRHYETAFYDFALSDSNSYEQWREEGGQDIARRAQTAWRGALAAYEPPPLDPGIADALDDFVARRKAAVADAWY